MNKKVKKSSHANHDDVISDIIVELKSIHKKAQTNDVVRKKAIELKGSNDSETIDNCFNYVTDTVSYKNDPPGQELITSPWLLIEGKVTEEDCESMVLLLASLLSVNGVRSKFRVIAWRKKQYSHIVLVVKEGQSWVVLDPTMGRAGKGQTIPDSQIKRKKDYSLGDNMASLDIVTLSDTPSPKTKKRCCRGRRSGNQNVNVNNINIGNELKEILEGRTGHNNFDLNESESDSDYSRSEEINPAKKERQKGEVPYYEIISDGKIYKYYESI